MQRFVILDPTIDMAAKSRKKHNNQISGLVISVGFETEIRKF